MNSAMNLSLRRPLLFHASKTALSLARMPSSHGARSLGAENLHKFTF